MATYAIGDVQGCLAPLKELLALIEFDAEKDTLWFAGDLINRGPASLETLRFIRGLPHKVVVLGNHDMHLLVLAHRSDVAHPEDTVAHILEAPDAEELLQWLRTCSFLHVDTQLGCAMSHAGVYPFWTLEEALGYARELEAVLQGDEATFATFCQQLYGDEPQAWSDDLKGMARLRFICNVFTRMRFLSEEGELEFLHKHGPGTQPVGYHPWFHLGERRSLHLIFGHWASLRGISYTPRVHVLDTGCVQGGRLTALRLEDLASFSVPGVLKSAQ